MHLARRVAGGEVQRREIVVVGLDVRPFGDREAHIGEDGGDLVDHLPDRMDAAPSRPPSRTGKVTSIRSADRRPRGPLRRALALAEDGVCDLVAAAR